MNNDDYYPDIASSARNVILLRELSKEADRLFTAKDNDCDQRHTLKKANICGKTLIQTLGERLFTSEKGLS